MLTEVQEDQNAHRGPRGSINAQNLTISNHLMKMTSLCRAHRHLSNGANDKSNRARMQKL
jgi:hypothetical protein